MGDPAVSPGASGGYVEDFNLMRPLEWLFLLALLPAVLFLYLPPPWQQRRLLGIAALLSLLVGALHLGIEGWRIPMIPLYGLAVLIPLAHIARRKRAHRPGVLVSALMALLLLGAVLLPGWVLPIMTLPRPSGPYQVGLVDRELTDTVRGRRLMISVWYPAAGGGNPAPWTRHPREVALGLTTAFGFPAAAPLLYHLGYSTVAASDGVQVLPDQAPFPVLVFSHGTVGLRNQSSSILQDLASWGYVVVSIDHTDAAAVTVFPDGETRLFDLRRFGLDPADPAGIGRSNEVMLPIWVADQRFVYDTLEQWADDDPLLADSLDLNRIGSLGHSFGGVVAVEVCRVDERCGAAVNMDGGDVDPTKWTVRPLLIMSSSDTNRIPKALQLWAQQLRSASGPAYWLELPKSDHFSFTVAPLISPLLAPSDFDARAGLGVISKYLRAFFDQYLRGEEAPLFGPDSGETDVRWRTE